jgi:NAD(P)-dependent dehydrogenase (short-subunit alcohol dehydrogenase family)
MELDGKCCIITGAASGIGRAVAEYFAADGAKVAMLDMQKDFLEEAARGINEKNPGAAKPYICDVRKVPEIRSVVAEAHKHLGRIDVLANIAGVSKRAGPDELTEEDWDLVLDVNLKGAFFMAQACYRIMLEQGRGKIINMGSPRAFITDKKHVAYDASKGGLHSITNSFAVHGGSRGVTANAVAPGYVITGMTAHNLDRPDFVQMLKDMVPQGRMLDLKEVVAAIAFLASDRCDGVNGHVFVIDGGMSKWGS